MGIFSPEISTREMVPVCRQLATAYSAGIPIIRSLETVGEQFRAGRAHRVFTEMANDIRQGSTLGEALDRQRAYLPPVFVYLIKAGEVGGHLDTMLSDLATYYEERLEMQRRVRGMMILPVLELIAAWFLGTFAWGMMNVALGAMQTGEGGGVSGVMAYVNDWISFQIKAGVVFALLVAIAIVLSRLGALGWITGFFSTHVWPMSTIAREMGLARFFKSFSLLLGSGLDVVRCIQNAAASTANPYIERDLLRTIPEIRAGSTLSDAFRRTRYLTPMSRNMLETGEVSGQLEKQLSKAAEYHFNQGTAAMHRATTIFGTLIVLAVCLFIGGLIISFYSRLYGGIMDELGI